MTRPNGHGLSALAGIIALCAVLGGTGCSGSDVDAGQAADLAEGLRTQGKPPAEYVLGQFQDHDVVLLGEFTRVRQDAEFVVELMPRLYHEVGVQVFATEFACGHDQAVLDSLVRSSYWDEARAIELLRRYAGGTWPYREYLDVYKAVWDVNRKLDPGETPMELVGLTPFIDWFALNEGDEVAQREQRLALVGTDALMAHAVRRHALAVGRKALVYTSYDHAFSSFEQPIVQDGRLVRVETESMGNLLRQEFGDRVTTILMHGPWPGRSSGELRSPCDGVLDATVVAYDDSVGVGFDVAGSAFASLSDSRSSYSFDRPDFRLDAVCDGYVAHQPISGLVGVTVITSWITDDAALERARRQFPDPAQAAELSSIREFLDGFQRDAALQTRLESVR